MPSTPSDVEITDPDDAWILAAAIQADADVLITGDAAFLAVSKQVGRPRIISPRGFWEMHRGSAP
jgi:predicted nucleic acid-binding protein